MVSNVALSLFHFSYDEQTAGHSHDITLKLLYQTVAVFFIFLRSHRNPVWPTYFLRLLVGQFLPHISSLRWHFGNQSVWVKSLWMQYNHNKKQTKTVNIFDWKHWLSYPAVDNIIQRPRSLFCHTLKFHAPGSMWIAYDWSTRRSHDRCTPKTRGKLYKLYKSLTGYMSLQRYLNVNLTFILFFILSLRAFIKFSF